MIVVNILILTVVIIAGFLGALVILGFVLHFIERKNMRLIARTFGTGGIIATGFGTVIHETGHLIMCLIFGHKVIKVELFRPVKFKSDGVLGKVTHSYNKRNFWQTMGNFFIGAGPIIFGITVIALLLWLLLPDVSGALTGSISEGLKTAASESNSYSVLFKLFFTGIGRFVAALFAPSNLITFRFWLFVFLSACIAMHMSLSGADLNGCGKGVASIILIAFIISVILAVLDLSVSISWLISYNIYVVSFLTMGIILSGIVMLVMIIPYLIKRRIVRNRIRKKYRAK